jgi:uncharacterized repeat protein (TIGR01451 family)
MTLVGTRRALALLATVALLALAAFAWSTTRSRADAAVPATATSQHFYALTRTDRFGWANVNLQAAVNPADVVVKVASGASNLSGEDPSFATVNFAGFVDPDTVRVRVIGWHANLRTGIAEFRYYSSKNVTLAVDVYPRTTPPAPPPPASANLAIDKTASTATVAGPDVNFTYTIKVTNLGPDPAAGVKVTDTWPAGLDAPATLPTGCTFNATTRVVTCDLAGVAADPAGESVTLAARTNSAATGTLANTATVAATTADPVAANNTDTVSIAVG